MGEFADFIERKDAESSMNSIYLKFIPEVKLETGEPVQVQIQAKNEQGEWEQKWVRKFIPIKGVYSGKKIKDTQYGAAAEYNIIVDGESKFLTSGSKVLAVELECKQVAKGDLISITRVGESFDTNYSVENLTKATEVQIYAQTNEPKTNEFGGADIPF